jgi:hypothetical protein
MGRKKRGMNELRVNLLPEKAKRDYILRLVSSIIVLLFLIINIVVVYIPYNRYNNLLNDLRFENSLKEKDLQTNKDKYDAFFHDIFNYQDSTIKDIKTSSLDFKQITRLFLDDTVTYLDVHDNLTQAEQLNPDYNMNLKPVNSTVQYIDYNEVKSQFKVSMKFDSMKDLTSYQNNLITIQYIVKVENSIITPEVVLDEEAGKSYTRYKCTFTITINQDHLTIPKVEGYR